MFNDEFIHIFRKFDPIERYIMSRDDGHLNKLFTITKGQLIDLYHFATFKDEEGLDDYDEEALLEHVKKEIADQKERDRLKMLEDMN